MSASHPLLDFGAAGSWLHTSLAGGRFAAAYLIEGEDEASLLRFARCAAASLISESPPNAPHSDAWRRVDNEAHPDVHFVTRDKATVISVAAIGPVLERAHRTPLEAVRQVFIVHPAEAMEPEGIARYLKTLEEPPEHTHFLLVTTRPERLPDTVRSRCRRLRLPPLTTEQVARLLCDEGIDPGRAEAVAPLAGARLARARRLAAENVLEALDAFMSEARQPQARIADASERVLAVLKTLPGSDGGTEGRQRQSLREGLQDMLFAVASQARDAAAERPGRWLQGLGPDQALDLVAEAGRLEADVAANVTPVVVLLALGVSLRRLLPRHSVLEG